MSRVTAAMDVVRMHTTMRAEHRIWQRYRRETLIPSERFVTTLGLLRLAPADGIIVECGAWRGGMSAAMAEALPGRTSVLFDSFQGLPPIDEERDGEAARSLVGTLAVSKEIAEANMRRSGARYDIRPGWFADTVPPFARERPRIAVLRLDGDWYDSTLVCLEHLFPLVVTGGLVLVDDYYDWEGSRRAVHDYLSRERRPEPLRMTRGVVYLHHD
jgi:O-methyltransferase